MNDLFIVVLYTVSCIYLLLSKHRMKGQVWKCTPVTQKVEAGGLQVQGKPGVHNEALSQKKATKIEWMNEYYLILNLPLLFYSGYHSNPWTTSGYNKTERCIPQWHKSCGGRRSK